MLSEDSTLLLPSISVGQTVVVGAGQFAIQQRVDDRLFGGFQFRHGVRGQFQLPLLLPREIGVSEVSVLGRLLVDGAFQIQMPKIQTV